MFGIEDLTEKTIEEIKKVGGKINLSFKGEGLIAEIDLEVKNEYKRKNFKLDRI